MALLGRDGNNGESNSNYYEVIYRKKMFLKNLFIKKSKAICCINMKAFSSSIKIQAPPPLTPSINFSVII
jgi:hypothetical protein